MVHLRLPALRERPADILELAQRFTRKYAEANGLPVRPLSADAKRLVTKPLEGQRAGTREHHPPGGSPGDRSEIGAEAITTPEGESVQAAASSDPAARAVHAAEAVTRGLVGRTVADVEQDLILDTLDHCLGTAPTPRRSSASPSEPCATS